MTFYWSIDETFKFIEAYRNEAYIWNPKHRLYKEKRKVNEGWNHIAGKMNIPVSELKKRKESLMATFRMLFKKKIASIRRGSVNIYKPVWTYYDAMEIFLKDIYEKSIINTTETEAIYNTDIDMQFDDIREVERVTLAQEAKRSETIQSQKSPSVASENFQMPVRQRCSSTSSELLLDMNNALTTLIEVLSKKNNEEDACSLYGKLLATKLKQFSPTERSEIMYEIDGLMMGKRQMVFQDGNIS